MRDTFVEGRLPPPELLPELRFGLPELQYPERLNAAAELLKGGAPDALAAAARRFASSINAVLVRPAAASE